MNGTGDTRDAYFERYVPLPTLPEPPLTWDTLTSASLDVIPLFDRTGRAVGWMSDGVIFDDGLQPRAFLRGTAVFNYRSQYLGQWAAGLMRDRRGEVVAFSEGALHGPALPIPR